MEPKKLKPITFIPGKYPYYGEEKAKSLFLLNALRITQDPKKLRELIGVRTVAEVYRTLDKIVMRKEYHSALAEAGISFNYIVQKIKHEADTAEESKDRLAAIKTLLKSIGLDQYKESSIGGGSWEDALPQNENNSAPVKEVEDYEVVAPLIPDSVKKKQEQEKEDAKGMYD